MRMGVWATLGRWLRRPLRLLGWVLRAGFVIAVILLVAVSGYLLGWSSWSPPEGAGSRRWVKVQRPSAPPPPAAGLAQGGHGDPRPERSELEETWESLAAARDLDGLVGILHGLLRFSSNDKLGWAQAHLVVSQLDLDLVGDLFNHLGHLPRSPRRDDMLDLLLRRWSKADPAGALEASLVHLVDFESLHLPSIALDALAAADPRAAFEAWKKHFAPHDVPYADSVVFRLSGVFRRWAEIDFDAAMAAYGQLPEREAKYALRGMAGREAAGADALIAHLVKAGETSAAADLREDFVEGLAREEPARAIDWLDAQEIAPEERAELEVALAENWVWEDPHAAAEWLLARADEASRPGRIRAIVGRWAGWEPNACGQWLNQMIETHGAGADEGVAGFALAIARDDPVAALEWASSVADPAARQAAAAALGRRLGQHRVQGAEALIRDAPLAPAEQEAALAALRGGR